MPIALLYPQPSRLALSTLGWQVVYRALTCQPGLVVERFFADSREAPSGRDDPDRKPPLRSEESGQPLDRFPVLAVSLNFELDCPDFLRMLLDAGIEPHREQRPDYPLIIAGGPLVMLNPAPMSPFVDAFFIGEAEAGFADLLAEVAGLAEQGARKSEVLAVLADKPGILVPGLSRPPVRRVLTLAEPPTLLAEPAYSSFVSPHAEFPDMLLLEINRGCPYGCRFCAAGYVYRPSRHADMATLKAIVERERPRKVGLVGTALTDWPELRPFLEYLHGRSVKFSLSSVRADGLDDDLLAFLRRTGARTLTLALEGGCDRRRRAMNKNLDEEDYLNVVRLASQYQFNHLKTYLIIGWPGNAADIQADLDGLESFLKRIQAARDEGRGNRRTGLELITLSLACLVPKPWTPLQWAPMASEAELDDITQRIKAMCKSYKGLKLLTDSPFAARMQGLVARGDAAVGGFLLESARTGELRSALAAWGGDVAAYLDRERAGDESFAWECLDMGVSRRYLRREWERFATATPTAPCPADGCRSCARCGAQTYLGDLARPGAT